MIVIFTALGLEYAAVHRHMVASDTQFHDGTVFEVGALRRRPTHQVALAEIGKGNNNAAVLTDRAIEVFRPAAVLFVGIAGALQKWLPLGDVVISNRIYAYHGGRVQSDEFLAHPRSFEVRQEMVQAAIAVRHERSWTETLPKSLLVERVPDAHIEPIAAGEVVLNSLTSPEAERLRQHYNDAVAVEMESAGVAQATHLNQALPMAAVRGISDRANGTKDETDGLGHQPVAAATAAAFAVALAVQLEELLAEQQDQRESRPAKPGSRTGTTSMTSQYNGPITTHGQASFGPQVNH